MRHDGIRLFGSFRYGNPLELARALGEAREVIDDEEVPDADWLRAFVRQGAVLKVDTRLPLAADRYVTAAVMQTLARSAIDGVVEASRDGYCLDWFPAG